MFFLFMHSVNIQENQGRKRIDLLKPAVCCHENCKMLICTTDFSGHGEKNTEILTIVEYNFIMRKLQRLKVVTVNKF